MLSAVQAVSQLHMGGVSVLPSAKAAVGISINAIQNASTKLKILCFTIIDYYSIPLFSN